MRIDKLFDKLCLLKTRSIAKKMLDKNLVKINGIVTKPSKTVKAGDVIEYEIYGYRNKIKIVKIPKGNVAKAKAPQYYEILAREKLVIEQ